MSQRSECREGSPAGGASENLVEVLGRQAESRPDGAHVLRGEGLAGGDVAHGVERAAKREGFLLHRTGAIAHAAQGLPGPLAFDHQAAQFVRLQGEGRPTPPSARARVKCFSMTVAPKATAATARRFPWCGPERPTSQPVQARRLGSVLRWEFSGVAGQVLVHRAGPDSGNRLPELYAPLRRSRPPWPCRWTRSAAFPSPPPCGSAADRSFRRTRSCSRGRPGFPENPCRFVEGVERDQPGCGRARRSDRAIPTGCGPLS